MIIIKKKITFIIPIAIIVIYFLFVLFFNNTFLPNTYINNVDYSGKTVSDTEFQIKNNTKSKTLELIKNDGSTENVDLSTLDYNVELKTDLNEILQHQNSFTWIINLFQKNYYNADVNISYNTDNINTIIDSLKCVTSQKASAPQDAYVEKTDDGYKIVPETEGSLIDKEALKKAIISAIENNETSINLSKENCYQKAKITTESDEIKNVKNVIDNINSLTITYDFADRQEVLNPEQIQKWISIDGTTINVDEDSAKQYITNLAYKYDTYQKKRTFTTTDGNEIKVSGGIYGWQTDINASTSALIEAIKNCESVTIEPIYKIEGLCRETNDIGNTYVEISIEKQHMWYYKDGELFLDTDVITGLPNGKRDTPTGVFCIWSREKNRTLGNYATQGYQSFVKYWMPIDWTGVGIHDASWQSSYGGSVYKTKGSHGCINTPYDAVEKLFNNCVTNTPVIIY